MIILFGGRPIALYVQGPAGMPPAWTWYDRRRVLSGRAGRRLYVLPYASPWVGASGGEACAPAYRVRAMAHVLSGDIPALDVAPRDRRKLGEGYPARARNGVPDGTPASAEFIALRFVDSGAGCTMEPRPAGMEYPCLAFEVL